MSLALPYKHVLLCISSGFCFHISLSSLVFSLCVNWSSTSCQRIMCVWKGKCQWFFWNILNVIFQTCFSHMHNCVFVLQVCSKCSPVDCCGPPSSVSKRFVCFNLESEKCKSKLTNVPLLVSNVYINTMNRKFCDVSNLLSCAQVLHCHIQIQVEYLRKIL